MSGPKAGTLAGSRDRREGLAALAKCLLLLLGTPAALARLWLAAPTPEGGAGAAVRVLLVVLAIGWLLAASRLVGDLVRALRGEQRAGASWSWRWAAALAGLLLAATATTRAIESSPSLTTFPRHSVIAGAPRSPGPATSEAPRAPEGRAEGARATAERAVGAGHDLARSELAGAVALVGLGLLGCSALVRRLRSLRRLGECFRSAGERLAEPDPATAWTEALIGPLGDADLVDWIEAANRLLWRSLRDDSRGGDGPAEAAEVRLVRAGAGGVELLLARPIEPAPDGFVALDEGRRWLLDPELGLDELEALTSGSGRALASLIPVGDDGQASYLVPVGADRRMALLGDERHVRPVLAYLLVALRTLPWAEELAVELVACALPDPAEHCYQMNASSWAELSALADRAPEPDCRLAATWSRTPLVLVGTEPSPTEEAILQRLCGRSGVISVGGSGTERLVLDAKGAYLEPLGIELDPPRPSPAQLAIVESLLESAARPAVVRDPPRGAEGLREDRSRPSPRSPLPAPPCPGPVEVRLLDGMPRLAGRGLAKVDRDAARAVEVVAYLALHGHEASVAELQESVFRRVASTGSAARVHNVCSVARRMLGLSREAGALLPAASAGRFRLDSAVSCDWLRFQQLAADARELSAPEAASRLEEALALVGERPQLADGGGSWRWFIAEGFARDLVSGVVDAAHHLACLCLAAGDGAAARRAIARGRLLEPASELLVRDLLAACDLDGDRSGLEQAYAELESSLDGLGGHEPSEATQALFESLWRERPSVDA